MIANQEIAILADVVADRIVSLLNTGHALPPGSDESREALADAKTLENGFCYIARLLRTEPC